MIDVVTCPPYCPATYTPSLSEKVEQLQLGSKAWQLFSNSCPSHRLAPICVGTAKRRCLQQHSSSARQGGETGAGASIVDSPTLQLGELEQVLQSFVSMIGTVLAV
jgi:hypothetical protein